MPQKKSSHKPAKASGATKQQLLNEIRSLTERTQAPVDTSKMTYFSELPLSERTASGLSQSNFVEMTDIQKTSLGKSLAGCDILGAAKTGSGKTLAFLIPVLERLYRAKWSIADGIGAIIISPTRELALQIFSVLRKIGKRHELSAGLIIGGKDVEFEKERVGRMNILVCTPGRLLQHMDETVDFDCSNLQMLVLDEADRILDLGFKKTVNAILTNLPQERQTLLFSATQTKSVRDLARLSLKDPEYVAVHEAADVSTPESLSQNYLVCEAHEKLDILFSFLKTHLQSKVLVFISSCKQVRFAHETFCKLQPGIVLMCLHGKQKQDKRNIMFEKFSRSNAAVMFCTDIAARGLDFPKVDWVVQVDCPEDGETYIHRVGRTARYNSNGHALLFLLPSEEEGMLALLEKKKVPIAKIAVNPTKTRTIVPQLQALCAQNPELKYLGEKAFICYLRSIWLQKHKDIFDVKKIDVEQYASSLGLPGAPKIRFIRKLQDGKNMAAPKTEPKMEDQQEEGDSDGESTSPEQTRKLDKMFQKKNQSVLWSHYEKIKSRDDSDDEDADDFLTMARKDHDLDGIPTMAPGFLENPLSVRDKRKQKLKQRVKAVSQSGQKVYFDEDGQPHLSWKLEQESEFLKDNIQEKRETFLNAVASDMVIADKEDKTTQKEKLREKKRVKKLKARKGADDEGSAPVAVLGSADEDAAEMSAFESENDEPPRKIHRSETKSAIKDEEELALKLLGY